MIGHEILIKPLLKSGALVAPFGLKAVTGNSLILELAEKTPPSRNLKQIAAMLAGDHR